MLSCDSRSAPALVLSNERGTIMSTPTTLSEAILQYQALGRQLETARSDVQANIKQQRTKLRDQVIATLTSVSGHYSVVLDNPQEVISTLYMLMDTNKFFSISWKRKTTSKSKPNKAAGSIDSMVIRKVQGYVKGTTGGQKSMDDTLAGRITVWVANGTLQSEGFGNWRTVYAKDITAIHMNGVEVSVSIQ